MTNKGTTQPELPSPNLLIPKAEASRRFDEWIKKGKELLNKNIITYADLDKAKAEYSEWSDRNTEILKVMFDNESRANEYNRLVSKSHPGNPGLVFLIKDFREDVERKITRLESIKERLELSSETAEGAVSSSTPGQQNVGKDIFIVHWHDNEAKETVAKFITQLEFNPTILHEKPTGERTIIEKIEDYSNVAFAVVLLTHDDIFCSEEKGSKKHRAHPNAIFELGYLIGKLGQKKVCALYKSGVEIPSDFKGILHIEMDINGGWKLKLAKEIKESGIEVDLTKAV